ncbi:MAG: hypothetical protein RBT65_15010 [Methanolobus sp.]|nr:hypothetical protein [Methanolobus sp.]
MNNKKTLFSLLVLTILFISVVMVSMTSAKNTNDKNKTIEVSDELLTELGRLSTEEMNKLAETNETVRMILEEDLKLDGAKIESLEDLKWLPEGYSAEMKQSAIDNLTAEQA